MSSPDPSQPASPAPPLPAMEALACSEEGFRLFVESVSDYAIFMLDPQGRVVSWNEGAERIKGYRAEEIVGRHFSVFYTQADVARGHPLRELELAAQLGRYGEEGWRVRKDGTQFLADVTITALWDASGRLRGFGKVTRDVTELKRAEEEVRQNALLEARVRERTAALEASRRELEAFSYSVSHDLRAPLRGIDGFARILQQRYAEGLDAQARHYLERIRAGTQRMGGLIDDLLRLSRISRAQLEWQPVDLAVVATEIVERLRESEPQREVEVVVADGLWTRGDAHLLRIVLDNLLSNAWKFTSHTAHARIEVGVEADRVFFVRDNGAGFDMQYAERLFAPFQRLHDADEFEGNGIGLATVQRIIVRHGGWIQAEGVRGGGATFRFTVGSGA